MSWLFASGSQSIGASASISVLPVTIQGWILYNVSPFCLLTFCFSIFVRLLTNSIPLDCVQFLIFSDNMALKKKKFISFVFPFHLKSKVTIAGFCILNCALFLTSLFNTSISLLKFSSLVLLIDWQF